MTVMGPNDQTREVAWTRLSAAELPRCHRFLAVMGEMDRHYREEAAELVIPRMLDAGCVYFLGEGSDFELAIGFQWDAARETYGLRTLGFRGRVQPHEALDFFVPKFLSFLRDQNLPWIFAIQPTRMDNPLIVQLYGLVPWRKDVILTGGHQLRDGIYWRIAAPTVDRPCALDTAIEQPVADGHTGCRNDVALASSGHN